MSTELGSYTPDPKPTIAEKTKELLALQHASEMEIAKRICEMRGLCIREGRTWDSWIAGEEEGKAFGSRQTIFNYVHVFEAFGNQPPEVLKNISWHAMTILAARGDKVYRKDFIESAIMRAKRGEEITAKVAAEMNGTAKDQKTVSVESPAAETEPAPPHEEANIGEKSETDGTQLLPKHRVLLAEVQKNHHPMRAEVIQDNQEDELPDDADDLDPETDDETDLVSGDTEGQWDCEPGTLIADGYTIPDMIRYIHDHADELIREYEAEHQPVGVSLDLKAMVTSLGM